MSAEHAPTTNGAAPADIKGAQRRVLAFVTEWKRRTGCHPEEIYALGMSHFDIVLTVADLATLATLNVAPQDEKGEQT